MSLWVRPKRRKSYNTYIYVHKLYGHWTAMGMSVIVVFFFLFFTLKKFVEGCTTGSWHTSTSGINWKVRELLGYYVHAPFSPAPLSYLLDDVVVAVESIFFYVQFNNNSFHFLSLYVILVKTNWIIVMILSVFLRFPYFTRELYSCRTYITV